MSDFSITLRFEIIGNHQFKDSDEFYNYLLDVFAKDQTVLRMVTVEDKGIKYCQYCGKKT